MIVALVLLYLVGAALGLLVARTLHRHFRQGRAARTEMVLISLGWPLVAIGAMLWACCGAFDIARDLRRRT